jgi:hypothetical protein
MPEKTDKPCNKPPSEILKEWVQRAKEEEIKIQAYILGWTNYIILDRYKRGPLTEVDYMREEVLIKDIAIDIIEDQEDKDKDKNK